MRGRPQREGALRHGRVFDEHGTITLGGPSIPAPRVRPETHAFELESPRAKSAALSVELCNDPFGERYTSLTVDEFADRARATEPCG